MSVVFKTNKNNYLVADREMPVGHLEFQAEGLEFLGSFNYVVSEIAEKLKRKSDKSYELGSGYGKYDVNLIYLNGNELHRVLSDEINNLKNEVKDINHRQSRVPEIEDRKAYLEKLRMSLEIPVELRTN